MDFVGNVVKGGSNLVSHHNTFRPRLPENREEKWSKQLWRSYSLPTSRRSPVVNNGDPSITFLDDTNIQIKIDSDSESIPVEVRSDASSNIGVEKGYFEKIGELYAYALTNRWDRAKSIYDELPDMVRIPLTATGDTALHVAVSAKSTTFVKELVTLMTPGDLEISNVDGNTAFCMAAITGNGDLFQIMIDKNENLPVIPGHDGMLPVHLAALTGHHKIVQHLSSDNLLQKMDFKHIQQLFFMTIIDSSMYDVAIKLLEKYPEKLVVARYDKDQLTALHMLAQKKPSRDSTHQSELFKKLWSQVRQLRHHRMMRLITHPPVDMRENSSQETLSGRGNQLALLRQLGHHWMMRLITHPPVAMRENSSQETLSGRGNQLALLQKVWFHVRQLDYNEMMELITRPSVVLFDAVKSGNVEAVKWLLYMNRELLTIRDPENGRNLLHIAVLYRQHIIFHFLLKMGNVNFVIRAVDKDRNNVLHFAARQEQTSSSWRPNIQLQRELTWLKEAGKTVPSELWTMRNSDGETPKDIFYASHMELFDEVKESAKGLADSGMVVATLVVTVAFAAALTVPGDKSSAAFIVFILTNAVALFAASASIVSFLSIFTSSRFTESEFIISLHPCLILGIVFLSISIVTMVIAFVAASLLIFDHIYKWVAYVVASLGLLPILIFFVLQLGLLDGLLYNYFFW